MPLTRLQKAPSAGAFLFCLLLAGLGLLAIPGPVRPAPGQTATIRYVIDGDTVILQDGRHARLIGINAPELGRDGRPDQPLARDARQILQRLIGQRPVRLIFGTESHDHYGRLLVHVVLRDGKTAQQHLLERGLASVVAYPPNLRYLHRYRQAEAAAQRDRRGLWGHPYYASIPAARITRRHRGYRFIHGRVEQIRQGRFNTYLVMSDRLVLQIPDRYRPYFNSKLKRYRHKQVVARGWLTSKHGKFRIRIRHPAMLSVIE